MFQVERVALVPKYFFRQGPMMGFVWPSSSRDNNHVSLVLLPKNSVLNL